MSQQPLHTLAGATLSDVQDATLALICQHGDVAVPPLDGFLIERQPGMELLGISTVETSFHCPLDQVVHLSGRETEDLGSFVLDLGGQQEVDGEGFEKKGETRVDLRSIRAALQGASTVFVPCWGQITRGRAAMSRVLYWQMSKWRQVRSSR